MTRFWHLKKNGNAGSWRALLKYMRRMGIVLELYQHTNQQVATHNIWEMTWPSNIALSCLPPSSHSSADTTLFSRLSHNCLKSSLISISCREISFPLFYCSLLYHSSWIIGFSIPSVLHSILKKSMFYNDTDTASFFHFR